MYDFGYHQQTTRVDSKIAKYYLEKYRLGNGCDPKTDRHLSSICEAIADAVAKGDSPSSIKSTTDVDLIAAIYADVLKSQCDSMAEGLTESITAHMRTPEVAGSNNIRGHAFPESSRCLVLIVPGAFHETSSDIKEKISSFQQHLQSNGFLSELVQTNEYGNVHQNAELVKLAISRHQHCEHETIILSLSRGASEVQKALFEMPADSRPKRLHTWISISGIPGGTPMADHFTKPFLAPLTRIYLRRLGFSSLEGVREMSVQRRCRDASLMVPPPSIRVICAVPILLSGASLDSRRLTYRYLNRFGPNDGLAVSDTTIVPGAIPLPVLGVDHNGTGVDLDKFGVAIIRAARQQNSTVSSCLPIQDRDLP